MGGLGWINRIPGDWGWKSESSQKLYRPCALRRICQADIADAYDHNHQACRRIIADQACKKMCVDITSRSFRNLASEGVVLSEAESSGAAGHVSADRRREAITRYQNDAAINSLRSTETRNGWQSKYFERHEDRHRIVLDDPLGYR